MRCPDFLELLDFLDRRLESERARRVEQHLASGCEKCAANRAWHMQFRSLGQTDSHYSPPPWAYNRALLLFEEERKRTALRSVGLAAIAQLSYDSFKHAAASGARAFGDSHRQLIYTAEAYSIDLQIGPTEPSGAEVMGQIIREGEPGFSSVAETVIDLNAAGEIAWSTVTNDIGEFMFIGVDFGDYDLVIDSSERQIKIPDVPVSL